MVCSLNANVTDFDNNHAKLCATSTISSNRINLTKRQTYDLFKEGRMLTFFVKLIRFVEIVLEAHSFYY
jgi:hypothetical protein